MKKAEKSQAAESENIQPKKGGALSQVEESLKENLKVTPSEITEDLVKDAKQAVNYEIRRGFRNLISGFFKR